MKTNIGRDRYLDIVKGVTIYLVVFAHCIQFGSGVEFLGGTSFYDNAVFTIINSFHMPLFMLISGYFCNVDKYSLQKGIWNKFSTLIIPIFSWQGLLFLAKYLYHIDDANIKNVLANYLIDSFESIWFLWAVFFCFAIVILINKIFNDNLIIVFIVFTASLFGGYGYSAHCFMFPFFVMGYFYRKNKKYIDSLFIRYRLMTKTVYMMLLYIVLMSLYNYRDYLDGYFIWGKNMGIQIVTNLYRISVGLVGSIFVLLLVRIILNYINLKKRGEILSQFFTCLGRYSIGIYIISGYINEYILWKITKQFELNYLIAFMQSVIIIAISYVVTYTLRKNRIAKKILLGGR